MKLKEKIVEVVKQLQRGRDGGVLPVEMMDFLPRKVIPCEQTMRRWCNWLWDEGTLERIGDETSRRGYRALVRTETNRLYHANPSTLLSAMSEGTADMVFANVGISNLGWLHLAAHVLNWRGYLYVIPAASGYEHATQALGSAGFDGMTRIHLDMGGKRIDMIRARKSALAGGADEWWDVGSVEVWAGGGLPLRLHKRLIEESTHQGGMVIDVTTDGSGPLAAIQAGRQFIAGNAHRHQASAAQWRIGQGCASRPAYDRAYVQWVTSSAR